MNIIGSITINTPNGQRTLNGDELQIEEFNNGPEIEIGWADDNWSVKKIFGGKPGESDGDWEVENCSITQENISVIY
jgi:hypothetical protein